MDLFDAGLQAQLEKEQPLAARLRPRTLDEFIGQDHILGHGRLLRRAIQADQLSSLIFYGPPGTGKTTLAAVIANTTSSHFISINAVLAGIADIRRSIDEAQERRKLHTQKTILFIDEVHRFNKAQQDALLPWVENGTVILIGATTENPYFSVNRPLLSRSRVFQLRSLDESALRRIVEQALIDSRGYQHKEVALAPEALDHLVDVANGDARALLNALELAVETTETDASGKQLISLEVAEESIQRRAVLYDKEGDYHFDSISAFIKSMRGSDPDATVYWLARMVYAGEDPMFIFRRMLIFASEDVGLADSNALRVVVAAAECFERIGLPEGRFPLAQAALYLATAPKSNSAFAFFDALEAIEKEREEEVPNHLKDASRDAEGFGHGANYLYPHAFRDHWVAQQYLPDGLQGRVFYTPSDSGSEATLGAEVGRRREVQLAAMAEGSQAGAEVLTFSPPDRARDQWLQRATSQVSQQLERQRERVFSALTSLRHHLILDLNAGTGLFTWEALRLVPDGGVWSLANDETVAATINETAAHLAAIERPEIVSGSVEQVESLIHDLAPEIRFDAVVGRNALGSSAHKEEVACSLARLLADTARVSLVEVVPRHSQRLHRLVDLGALGGGLAKRVMEAEEGIYADSLSEFVNWDGNRLEESFAYAGFTSIQLRTDAVDGNRHITQRQLDHWFNPGGKQHPTFSDYLQKSLSREEVERVKMLFAAQLTSRTVPWSSTQVYLTAEWLPG